MAEIKICDLSIGDWVKWKVYDKTYVIRITQITDTIIRGVHDGIEYGVLLKQISPIPLTPEILEKNGFERGEIYEGNSSIVFTNGNIRISWYKNAMWCRLRIYNALGDTELCSAIVHNVHQLQHALRLAGVGKDIEV